MPSSNRADPVSGGAEILCIGSVLWDIIGRSAAPVPPGADLPGRIARQPGGVALNIAVALRRAGLRPVLLSSVGRDAEGEALVAACATLGLETAHLHRGAAPTDRYMAIEGAEGLVAAVADTAGLEAAGEAILAPLADGRLGSAASPRAGPVVLDGNLTPALLETIAASPLFARADLRIAPASPAKAARLRPFLAHRRATLHLNRAEAAALCARPFSDAAEAAAALLAQGAHRVLVTDGARPCADGMAGVALLQDMPPAVPLHRITGAGDAFMAAHLAASLRGLDRAQSLRAALAAAACHVSGDPAP